MITDQRIWEIYEDVRKWTCAGRNRDISLIIERLLIVDKAFDDEILGNLIEVGGTESFDLVKETCLEEAAIKLRAENVICGDK